MRQVEEWPEPQQRRLGYVIAGEDWHRGVIGIVASRLVERFRRPVVLIAGGEPGEEWTGSGRSIPSFDLHGALGACSSHLSRWGGHRAAAGLSISPDEVEAFAQAFAAHAAGVMIEDDLQAVTTVDAVVQGRELTLGLCEELERLEPFGLGNPNVTLLAVGCELSELGAVGDGKHLRLAVTAAGRAVGRDRVRPGLVGSTGTADRGASTSRSGSRQTAGTGPSRRSSSSARSSTRRRATRSFAWRCWPNGRRGRTTGRPARARSSPSSASRTVPPRGGRSSSRRRSSPPCTKSPPRLRPSRGSLRS